MVRHIYVNVSCIPNSKSMKHDNAYILKNIVNNFCQMLRILKLQFLLKCKYNKIWKFFWISFLPPLVTFRLKKESKLNQSRLFSEENQNIIFHKRTGNSFYFLLDKALQTTQHWIFYYFTKFHVLNIQNTNNIIKKGGLTSLVILIKISWIFSLENSWKKRHPMNGT